MNKCIDKENKKLNKRLIICIISFLLILAKMYFFNNIFLIIAITILTISIIIDKEENKPIYLFFSLPLIYVMKFSNEQISLYNVLYIAYILSMLYIYIKNKRKVKSSVIIFLLALAILILINSLNSEKFNMYSSISWILNLFIFYLIIKEIKNKEIYNKYIYYFSFSVAIVGICGIIFMNNTNISIYLSNMRRTNTLITNGELNYRYSGFDLDPNYFSLQALIAFWCLFISNKNNNKYNYVLLFVLLIIGLTTISKMYIITLVVSFVFYSMLNIRNISKNSITKIFGVIVFLIILFSIVYKYIWPVFESRFENITDIDDLTTGRSEIWKDYSDYIFGNLKTLFIGEGIGIEYLEGHASHSLYILVIFRLGILGTILLIAFISSIMKGIELKILTIYSIPLFVFLITGFALDVLDFDSFSYLLVLVLGIYIINQKRLNTI